MQILSLSTFLLGTFPIERWSRFVGFCVLCVLGHAAVTRPPTIFVAISWTSVKGKLSVLALSDLVFHRESEEFRIPMAAVFTL